MDWDLKTYSFGYSLMKSYDRKVGDKHRESICQIKEYKKYAFCFNCLKVQRFTKTDASCHPIGWIRMKIYSFSFIRNSKLEGNESELDSSLRIDQISTLSVNLGDLSRLGHLSSLRSLELKGFLKRVSVCFGRIQTIEETFN